MKPKLLCRLTPALLAFATSIAFSGCGGGAPAKRANANFFTSGSREADQRASQRMAQSEQLTGSGEGAGEKGVKKAEVTPVDLKKPRPGQPASAGITNKPAQATEKLSLFERLGAQPGISNIVADFTPRVLDDPRVNWTRSGVTRGAFSLRRNRADAWKPTPSNVSGLQKHLIEFLALATGGPAQYTGRQIEPLHADMHISNPEFDAVIGDLKASLDKLKIPNLEQKELLAILESTRPQIVTKR